MRCPKRKWPKHSQLAGWPSSPILVDESNAVLDGHHRCLVAKRIGLTEIPVKVVAGLTDDQKREVAFDANDCRRHQSEGEMSARREVRAKIMDYILHGPDRSDRMIAEEVGKETGRRPGKNTVARARDELVRSGKTDQLERTTGKDGKSRPAKRPAPAKPDGPAAGGPRRERICRALFDCLAGDEWRSWPQMMNAMNSAASKVTDAERHQAFDRLPVGPASEGGLSLETRQVHNPSPYCKGAASTVKEYRLVGIATAPVDVEVVKGGTTDATVAPVEGASLVLGHHTHDREPAETPPVTRPAATATARPVACSPSAC